MDEETRERISGIYDVLITHGAALAVHDLFVKAVAMTHPDRAALREAFVESARRDDAKADALPDPEAYRRVYDTAYDGILRALLAPGRS